jgi:Tol biopolymer transport system component
MISGNIWITDVASGISAPATSDPAVDALPVFSPQGDLAFSSRRLGGLDLFVKSLSTSGAEEKLYASSERMASNDWSRKGDFLLFTQTDPQTGQDLWFLPMSGNHAAGAAQPFLKTAYDEEDAQFSPDTRWVAYVSNRSGGEFRINVRPFPGPGPEVPISPGAGTQPRWSRDGTKLFYISGDGAVMEVNVDPTGAQFRAGVPKRLFASQVFGSGAPDGVFYWDVFPDGKQFLMITAPPVQSSEPITVLLNWQSAMKK